MRAFYVIPEMYAKFYCFKAVNYLLYIDILLFK